MPYALARLLILFQQQETLLIPSNENKAIDESSLDNIMKFFENAFQNKGFVGAFIGIVTFISAICYHHAQMRQRMLGSKVRTACCSLIFRKVKHTIRNKLLLYNNYRYFPDSSYV